MARIFETQNVGPTLSTVLHASWSLHKISTQDWLWSIDYENKNQISSSKRISFFY